MRILLAAVLLLGIPARAAFEDLGAGARAPGLGGAFTPIADDVYALYYNPAGLGVLERPQLGTAYSALYPGLKDGSNLSSSWIGYAHPLSEGRQGALAASWSSLSLNSLYREDAFTLGYGRRVLSTGERGELYGGGAAKYLRSSFGSFPEASNAVPTGGVVGGGQADPVLSGRRSQAAVDLDAGLLWRGMGRYSVGLDLVHLNQPNVAFGAAEDRLPLAAKVGLAYRSLISNLAFQYETQKGPSGSRDQKVTAAAERWFPRLFVGDFGVRGALGVGSRDDRQVSLGLGYRTRRLGVDYAMALPIAGASAAIAAHRVALTFRFGRATEEEESLEMVLEAMRQLKAGRPEALKGGAGAEDAQRRAVEELLGQARSAEAHAQYAEAQRLAGRALTAAPGDKALVDRYARLSVAAQQFRALPRYRDDPAEASLHLGVLAYLAGDGPQAVQKVSYALQLAPERKDVETFLALLEGSSGVRRGTFGGAPSAAQKDAALALTRANAALEDGRYDEAIEQSLAALRADPQSAAAYENLGTAYFALKRLDESLQAWNRALDLEKSPALRTAIKGYIRSVTRARERRPAAAPASVPAPKPSSAPVLPAKPKLSAQETQELFNSAIDHYTKGELPQAKELLERILAADPDNVEAQKALRRVRSELP